MASILSLPLELRHLVYSYALQTRTHFRRNKLDGPSISLFLVNKQISDESIHYFYSTNAFSVIRFNGYLGFVVDEVKSRIPSCVIVSGLTPVIDSPKFILAATVWFNPTRFKDLTGIALITPARELDQLRPAVACAFDYRSFRIDVDISPHFDCPLFHDRFRLEKLVVEGYRKVWDYIKYVEIEDTEYRIVNSLATREHASSEFAAQMAAKFGVDTIDRLRFDNLKKHLETLMEKSLPLNGRSTNHAASRQVTGQQA